MQRTLIVMTLMLMYCAACATLKQESTDPRLLEAQAAFDEGKRLVDAGQYAEAVAHAGRALELREAALGASHPEVARALGLIGNAYRSLGNYKQAEASYQRALAIREVALGERHPDVASSLHNLATVYAMQGDLTQATQLGERALLIRKLVLGEDHADVATSLHFMASLYHDQGLYTKAEPLYERALTIRETVLGKSHRHVAVSLTNLALLYEAQGLYSKATPLFKRALAIQESALGENHPETARALLNLANHYRAQGAYMQAEPLYTRALETFQRTLGEAHPDTASALHDLANLYKEQGQYTRAEPLYKAAIDVFKITIGERHPNVSIILNSLAALYNSQGQYELAEQLYERALAIREEVFGKNHPDVAVSLVSLAVLYQRQGLYDRAKPLYERALAIQEEALGGKHPDTAISLDNLATLYAYQGQYIKAEQLYERARAIQVEVLGEAHPTLATTLQNLANLYEYQGQYERAESLSVQAIAIYEAKFGSDHPVIALLLRDLARIRLARKRLSEATPLLMRALTTSEGYLRREILSFSESRLTSVLQLLRTEEEQIYALARTYPGDAGARHLVLTTALLRKGRSVTETASTSRIIYHSLGKADQDTFEQLRTLRTQFAELSLAGPGALSASEYQQRLKILAEQGDALESELAKRSAPLRRLHELPSPAELVSQVAAALPPGSALVEFVAYDDSPLVSEPGTPPMKVPSEPRYLALLLFADGRIHVFDLGLAAPIDDAVLHLREALAHHTVNYQVAARELYDLAFRPLRPLLGNVQRLFVSPDGQMALAPLAALHDGRRFLIDSFDLVYLTSGKDLLPRREGLSPARSVVVLADPDFESTAVAPPLTEETTIDPSAATASLSSVLRSGSADSPSSALPGTRKEAQVIQRLFPQAQLLLGPEATKDALLKLVTPGILHIATHGFFLDDTATKAGTRGVVSVGTLGGIGPRRSPPEPLLRSGLILAGARASVTKPGSQRLDDSLVTALELVGMDLWGTQLVVLSACETGRGDVRLGQGVYGLRRALVMAGAETVVTSLWKVNDETTQELMESYYRNLLAGQGRAEALRQAMRTLRQKQPHPYFWAPFIAIGRNEPLQGLGPL